MKNLFLLGLIILLQSCFFSVGDLPPEFCSISESYMTIESNNNASGRCGDANIFYRFNQQDQLYELELNSDRMVPDDNGAQQDVGLFLTLKSREPISSGDYLNNPDLGWNYSVRWYDYDFYDIQTNVVVLSVSSDSTVSASVSLQANISNFQFDAPEPASFNMTFRNLKLPLLPPQ